MTPARKAASVAPPAAGSRRRPGPRRAIESILDERLAALPNCVPGAVVCVRAGSEERVVRSAARAGRPAPTMDTVFQVMSISKPVTALGVLALAHRGLVDLDAPIPSMLRSWSFAAEHLNGFSPEQITVRRLLCHAGGVGVHGYGWLEPGEPRPPARALLSGQHTLEQPISILHTPGSQARYSGGGYMLLQQALEDSLGRPFAAIMQEAIFEPLGMTSSAFDESDQSLLARLATPHDADGSPLPVRRCAAPAATGLYTTAADLLRFLDAVVPAWKGSAVGTASPAAVRTMTSCQARDPEGRAWGAGFYLLEYDAGTIAHHGGLKSGWWSQIDAFPRGGHAMVALTNGDASDVYLKPVLQEIRTLLLHAPEPSA